jgi:polyisoprenoid-binding protein YceI
MRPLVFLAALSLTLALAAPSRGADTYKADPVHSFTVFSVRHVNTGYVWGRFNDPGGTFTLDEADPTKGSFTIEIAAANVDTHNEKRDAHLKSPDFFNAKQYPMITFASTSVKKGTGNILEVAGNLQMHGVTRTITIPVELTGKGQFPPGVKRAGLQAAFTVKLSDFEIKGLPGAVADEIKVIVAIEGTR